MIQDMLQHLGEFHIRFFHEIQDFPTHVLRSMTRSLKMTRAPRLGSVRLARLLQIKCWDLMDLALLRKQIISLLPPAQQCKTLKGLWKFHNEAHKHTTHIEEDEHSKNKHFIGGAISSPDSVSTRQLQVFLRQSGFSQ